MRHLSKEILDVKRRNSKSRIYVSFNLKSLEDRWEKLKLSGDCDEAFFRNETDFYIIRAVTCIEVFTRGQLADLTDHAKQYTDRAIELSKHFKMDFTLAREVQDRAVTLGDIVSHSVPLNQFGQIIGYFETLLGRDIRPLLEAAVDRWQVEVMGQIRKPIIENWGLLAKSITRLFEIRHILCHELPANHVYAIDEVSGFLENALNFANALEEVIQFEKFGLTPLTQTGMNIEASERLPTSEIELDTLIVKIKNGIQQSGVVQSTRYMHDPEDTWVQCFDDAQKKWKAYRDAHSELLSYPSRGGTIWPLLRAATANEMTKTRTTDLQEWMERESEQSVLLVPGRK